MPLVISNNTIIGAKIGMSMPSDADVFAEGNIFSKTDLAIEVRDSATASITVITVGNKKLTIPGQWTKQDIQELAVALDGSESPVEAAANTKIGAYIRKKIGDPIAFAAEIASITSSLSPLR